MLVLALAAGLLAGCGRAKPITVPFSAKDADFRAVFPVTPSRSVKTATPSRASVDVITYPAVTTTEDLGVGFKHTTTAAPGHDVEKARHAAHDAETEEQSGPASTRE